MSDVPRRFRPFLDESGDPQLVECYVLSLDLLGTQTSTADDAARNLRVTDKALRRATEWAGGTDPATIASWFSDNVAVADVVDPPEHPEPLTFGFHLITAGWMQLELALNGLFSRGGLTQGPFFASELFVYGPALVEAYKLESEAAVHPRIILSDHAAANSREELIRFGGGDTEVHRKLLAVDDDGQVFVNYLDSIWDEAPEADAMIAAHRDHIINNLAKYSGDTRVRPKYEWLADYHDRYCRTSFGSEHVIGNAEGPRLKPFGTDVPLPERPKGYPGLKF